MTFWLPIQLKVIDSLSSTICWITKNLYGINVILYLLDDFETINRPTECGERTIALLSLVFNKLNIRYYIGKLLDLCVSLNA